MRPAQIPDRMTAAVLDAYAGPEALRVEQRPVPVPGQDEVLVKVAASPINPSDLAFLHGKYGFDLPPPVVPGGEGAGEVVAVGPGAMARYFQGKRVACLSRGERDGTWAEYVVVSTKGGVFPLNDEVGLEQGAMSVINPLTASAMLEIAKDGGHEAIVLTAAAGALGQMVNRLGRSEEVQVINVVRREAQVELLKAQGATVVLNSSDPDFDAQLQDACRQHDAHLAFDAVAGPMTAQLLKALPENSTVTVYSCLSREAPRTDTDAIVFGGRSVTGFWLGPWLGSNKNLLQLLMLWRRAQKLIATDLKSDVRARYPLQEARKAVEEYSRRMTGGKILLTPGETESDEAE